MLISYIAETEDKALVLFPEFLHWIGYSPVPVMGFLDANHPAIYLPRICDNYSMTDAFWVSNQHNHMLSKKFSAFFCFLQTRERLCYCFIMENKDAAIKNGDGIKHYLANKYSMSLIGHHWNTEHTELVPINLVKSPQLILNRVPVDEIQFK